MQPIAAADSTALGLDMDASDHRRWIPGAMLVALVYLAAGLIFGALAGAAAFHQMVVVWRFAAWVVSGIAFWAHIRHELSRLRSAPLATALHVSAAAALGAFGLAVAANIHRQMFGAGNQHLILAAMLLWPLLTAISSFVVAFAVAAVWARIRRPV
jgi:hypothetical protein